MENKNRFVALAEEEDEALTTADINALNGWSVKKSRKSKKHKNEKYLLPCSDLLKPSIPKLLDEANIKYTQATMYRTVCSDLSDLSDVKYDMLVFYSPSGIESLYKNFPDFEQGTTCIATFGPTTEKAAQDNKLRVDIAAPTPKAPSMTMAIQQYISGK